jgi:predicted RNase H-like HicB family nuclease
MNCIGKSEMNAKRLKPGLSFNSFDHRSSYAIRLELAKDGFWWANAVAFPALSVGKTIGKAKRKIGEAIQLWLEERRAICP